MFAAKVIVHPKHATAQEVLAAREIRRYLYLRTEVLLPILACDDLPSHTSGFAVARKGEGDDYRISTHHSSEGGKWIRVEGGCDGGVLYAAYRIAEHMGVRFALHGDIIPDQRISLHFPDIEETGVPRFALRGILPFHDFPEGPDWWNEDDYLGVIAQLPKLRLNFIGLHTYPEKHPAHPRYYNAEPGVWIGLPEDAGCQEDKRVRASYPARHFTTQSEVWGFTPRLTNEYSDGASSLYDRDDYGAAYMKGMTPWPHYDADENELFDRFGQLLQRAYGFAKKLGIRTCIGTEVPLTIPDKLQTRLSQAGYDPDDPAVASRLYEGIFTRILHTHELDYYWLWTPESWIWKGNTAQQATAVLREIQIAIEAACKLDTPFALATCGWVLGPQQDRAHYDDQLPDNISFACINPQFGLGTVDPAFAKITQRPKWAIPWLEDDPGMILPQLWVGRIRRDARDAAAYGCTGLMGIHWRTKIMDANITALAESGWNQAASKPEDGLEGKEATYPVECAIGGEPVVLAAFSDEQELSEASIYHTARRGADGYRLLQPAGDYQVVLHLRTVLSSEDPAILRLIVYGHTEANGRSRVVDVSAWERRNEPCVVTMPSVHVRNEELGILLQPIKGEACLCGIEIRGQTTAGEAYQRFINCGGEAIDGFETDLPAVPRCERHLPVFDFYLDWAQARFGSEAGEDIARLFASMDGQLPRPVVWETGPGSTLVPDRSPWEWVSQGYAFVESFEALRDSIRGPGNLERYDYWLNQFRYLRCAARIGCEWGVYEEAEDLTNAADNIRVKRELARQLLLPIRMRLIGLLGEWNRLLLATVSTPGELGTVANVQQQAMYKLVNEAGLRLEGLLEEPLPPDAWPSSAYTGEPRIMVPTTRTLIGEEEPLHLTVLFLGVQPESASLHWKLLGTNRYDRIPLCHVARGVYRAAIPAGQGDIEYYIEDPVSGLRYPATAGSMNQTVVRLSLQ